ncbi:MAG: hypothetical protein L3J91_00820, partial [Thermoplasmata archaeon]|nr:hypothetical protein [Thermoplasmata archaeon]
RISASLTDAATVPTTESAASDAGFILVVPNTRTGNGFYLDSPYTGPQAQDIQDAITTEESLRLIGSVYLYGFSMGGMGSLSIGLQHPTEFAGLGAIATFSDIYELYDYQTSHGGGNLNDLLINVSGALPNQTATGAKLRAHPELTKGLKMYFAAGGSDPTAPNNPSFWPYLEANDSILQSTCLVATDIAEPPNCTLPVAALHAVDPTNYSYRYVYEPNGIHNYGLLNATDLFAFFGGLVPDGPLVGTYPRPTPVAPPVPLVTLVTQPFGCGTISWAGTPFPNGFTIPFPTGAYQLSFSPCPGYSLAGVVGRDGVSYDGATEVATVTSSGALVAVFSTARAATNVSLTASTVGGCTTLFVNGTSVASGTVLSLETGSYVAQAATCPGFAFRSWTGSGGVSVWSPLQSVTGFGLTADGTVAANYVVNTATVSVTTIVSPAACAPIYLTGSSVANDSITALLPGTYSIVAPACPGFQFASWSLTGGLSGPGSGASAVLIVASAGFVTAVYAPPTPSTYRLVVTVVPASCGSVVSVDGVHYANGTLAMLAPGAHSIASVLCPLYSFAGWTVSGLIDMSGSTITVDGNGSVLASFTYQGGGSGGGTGTTNGSRASATPLTTFIAWAAVGLLAGLGIGAAVFWRRRPSPPEDADGPNAGEPQ